MKDPIITKVSAIPKSAGAEPTKPVSLEIYTNNKTKGISRDQDQGPILVTLEAQDTIMSLHSS